MEGNARAATSLTLSASSRLTEVKSASTLWAIPGHRRLHDECQIQKRHLSLTNPAGSGFFTFLTTSVVSTHDFKMPSNCHKSLHYAIIQFFPTVEHLPSFPDAHESSGGAEIVTPPADPKQKKDRLQSPVLPATIAVTGRAQKYQLPMSPSPPQ